MMRSGSFNHLPNPSSADKTSVLEIAPGKAQKGDAVGRPRSRSSLLRDPDANFFRESSESAANEQTNKNEKHSQLARSRASNGRF